MKSSTLKKFTSVHTWTGIGAGMLLFIAFYTGSITIFTHELDGWDEYKPTQAVHQDYDQAQQLIDKVMDTYPDAAEEFRLYTSEPGHHSNSLYWLDRQKNGDLETHSYSLDENNKLNINEDNAHLAQFIYRIHYTAGLPNPWGQYILGIICFIYALAIVTGLIIFLPNFLKDLFIVRPPKNNKRFWLDAHNVVGVISLPWHFMFAWSSAILTIGIFFLAPFQFIAFENDNLLEILGPELGFAQQVKAAGQPAELLSVPEIMAIANEQVPGIKPVQLRYLHAGNLNGTVNIFGELDKGTLTPRTTVLMSSVSGEVFNVINPQKSSIGATIYNGLIALHFVNFGGYTIKWVYFILGLAGAFLFYSGNLLWIESRRKRRTTEQPANTLFLARLNSGVCIGCMASVSASFLMSRATMELINRPDLTELAYFVVFFASIAWCFFRSVANGTRDLLYVCSLTTAAIPVFDIIFTDMPFWRSAIVGDLEMLTVDLLAIVGSAVFYKMARAVQKRSINGNPNSVWFNHNKNSSIKPTDKKPA